MGWLTSASGALRHIFGNRKRAEGPPQSDLMIVRRGLSPSFYFFCHVFAKEHGLAVVPDRRLRERRHSQRATPTIDRRSLERRGKPVNWPMEDFILVPDPRRTPRTPEES